MALLYSNENFPRRVVLELRLLGHDALTSFESGKANQRIPDDEVLAFATDQGRAVLTLNRSDFVCLHRDTQGKHAGIIVCTRDDADPVGFARRIHEMIGEKDLTGELIRVVRPQV